MLEEKVIAIIADVIVRRIFCGGTSGHIEKVDACSAVLEIAYRLAALREGKE